MIKRRDLIAMLAGASVLSPQIVLAQTSGKRPVIGYLETGRRDAVKDRDAAFLAGMRDLGYAEGQTFDIAYRFADDDYARLPALAEELVNLDPAVIVTAVTTAALAAAKATRTIPIVSAVLNDPVNEGLVASYAHPGDNVTGVMNTVEGLPGKLLEITLEVMPRASRIGMLINPANLATMTQWREIEAAATAKRVKTIKGEVRTADDLPSVFKAFSSGGVEAVMVSRDTVLLGAAARVAEMAIAAHLPTIAGQNEEVRAGELISYGTSPIAATRRAAYFVDKILRGGRPADLPVEFPTTIEMAVNLKTAKALNLIIAQSILLRADEVIE